VTQTKCHAKILEHVSNVTKLSTNHTVQL